MDSKRAFFDRAVAILDTVGCKYKIQSPYGEFGVLEVKSNEPARKHRKRGTIQQSLNPILNKLEVGDVAVIEFEPFKKNDVFDTIDDLGKTISKWFYNKHGICSATYHTNYDSNTVEVMRLK